VRHSSWTQPYLNLGTCSRSQLHSQVKLPSTRVPARFIILGAYKTCGCAITQAELRTYADLSVITWRLGRTDLLSPPPKFQRFASAVILHQLTVRFQNWLEGHGRAARRETTVLWDIFQSLGQLRVQLAETRYAATGAGDTERPSCEEPLGYGYSLLGRGRSVTFTLGILLMI